MEETNYLTVDQLSDKIHYTPRYIREKLLKEVLREGEHYFHPFGGRRILFNWQAIERDMMTPNIERNLPLIPLANGGICHG